MKPISALFLFFLCFQLRAAPSEFIFEFDALSNSSQIQGIPEGARAFHIAIDSKDFIYVLFSKDEPGAQAHVQILRSDGTFERSIALDNDADISEIGGFTVNDEGKLFISDTSKQQVYVFNTDGKLGKTFGAEGKLFKMPQGMAIDKNGNLIVVDSDSVGGKYVHILDADGNVKTTFGPPAEKDKRGFVNVAVDTNGNIHVAEGNKNAVEVFDADGTYLRKFALETTLPLGIAIDNNGNTFISDATGGGVKVYKPDGTFSQMETKRGDEKSSSLSLGLAINSRQNLFLLMQDGKVQVFRITNENS